MFIHRCRIKILEIDKKTIGLIFSSTHCETHTFLASLRIKNTHTIVVIIINRQKGKHYCKTQTKKKNPQIIEIKIFNR